MITQNCPGAPNAVFLANSQNIMNNGFEYFSPQAQQQQYFMFNNGIPQFEANKLMFSQFCPQGGYQTFSPFSSSQLSQVSHPYGGSLAPSPSGPVGGSGSYIGMSGGMIMSGNSGTVGGSTFSTAVSDIKQLRE